MVTSGYVEYLPADLYQANREMGQMSIALVCGATGGLGPAVVAAFRGRGDQVIAVARSHDELVKLSGVTPQVADLTRAEDVDAL